MRAIISPPGGTPRRVTVLGTSVDVQTQANVVEACMAAIERHERFRVAYAHFAVLLEARASAAAREALAVCDLVHADGIGVRWALRTLYDIRAPRISGSDLYAPLLQRAAEYGASACCLGGDDATARGLDGVLTEIGFPPGKAIAMADPGESRDAETAERIRIFAPDLLLVGMGGTRQYAWLLRCSDACGAAAIVLCGGGLAFLARTKARAPAALRDAGLEWTYRLAREPRRLWRRYLLGIPRFVTAVLREKLAAG